MSKALVLQRLTIADFREVLIAANAFESLFGVFLTRLQKQCGLALAKQGVTVDASFADSAYSGPPIEAVLPARQVTGQINEKGTLAHPLSEQQKASNRKKSKTRSRVEHVFAQMSSSMRVLYQRSIGMKCNTASLQLTNLVHHLPRFEQIKRLNLNLAA